MLTTMDLKLTDQPEGNSGAHFLAHCPVARKQVIVKEWQYIYLLDERVTWWRCPACRGWHVLRVKQSAADI
jgi:hypothetical protein